MSFVAVIVAVIVALTVTRAEQIVLLPVHPKHNGLEIVKEEEPEWDDALDSDFKVVGTLAANPESTTARGDQMAQLASGGATTPNRHALSQATTPKRTIGLFEEETSKKSRREDFAARKAAMQARLEESKRIRDALMKEKEERRKEKEAEDEKRKLEEERIEEEELAELAREDERVRMEIEAVRMEMDTWD